MSRARIKRRARRRASRKRKIQAFVALLAVIIVSVLSTAFGGFVAVGAILSEVPDLDEIGEVKNWQTTKVYAADGTLLTNLYYEQDRVVVPLSEIPMDLKKAVIAIEDERFYMHKGYDPEAIARALLTNLSSGETVEGASTITQQYVKNTMVSTEKTFERKVKEAALAYELEKKYTKEQILEKYLNTIYFGHSWYGVETASQNYFGKSAKGLTLPEAAMLAGIIKSPNNYSPHARPEAAKMRRDLVLRRMEKLMFITPEQAKAAIESPVQLQPLTKPSTIAPYFVEFIKQDLIKNYGENVVFKGGLRVYTTIDLRMQKTAEDAAWSTLNQDGDPSVSIVAVEPSTGHIKAMVGGRDFENSKYNLATSHNRQPGSSFKTFVFTAALENGMSPYKTYDSSPARLKIPGGQTWKVDNYVEGSGGPPMSISEGLIKSVNTVYARLILDVGPEKVVDVAKRMGITSPMKPYPAIALGGLTNGPSPLDMASAYGTLANSGRYCEPVGIVKVTDATGKVMYEHKPDPKQVISETTAYTVTEVLQDVVKRGTGTRARIGGPCAGKTGTAQSYRDAWFCGYTPELSAAVWVGYPQGQIPMTRVHGIRVSGGSFPAMIWGKFMSGALHGLPRHDFAKPREGLTSVIVCSESGLPPNKYCVETEHRSFPKENIPSEKCPIHTSPSIVEIPNVVGMSEADAKATLDKLRFGYSISYKTDESVKRGMVISQSPSGGEKARQSAVIELTVSVGSDNDMIEVPDVVGLYQKQAKEKLIAAGFNPVPVRSKYDNKIPRYKVLAQEPAPGTPLKYGEPVKIIVNK